MELAIGRFREMQALASDVASLEDQLATRKLVDRAKGMLMDGHGMKEAEAFAFIQKKAMSERTRMKDVADRIISGDLTP
jgi:two-component system, response regulator PdtaR